MGKIFISKGIKSNIFQLPAWPKLPKWQGGAPAPLEDQNIDFPPILEEQNQAWRSSLYI